MPRFTFRITLAIAIAALLAAISLVGSRALASGNAAPAAQAADTAHTVTVNGHGEVMVAPDMADITIGVDARGTSAQEALSKNGTSMNAVIAAIEGQGVPAAHIQTTNLSVFYDSQQDDYVASHQLDVRIDDIGKVGPVLDASVAAGANNSWGVNFGLQNPSQANSQALQSAVTDARSRADAIASKLQVTITGVGSAAEPSYNSTPVRFAGGAVPAASSSTPVQPGQLDITADISVVYTFTPQ